MKRFESAVLIYVWSVDTWILACVVFAPDGFVMCVLNMALVWSAAIVFLVERFTAMTFAPTSRERAEILSVFVSGVD